MEAQDETVLILKGLVVVAGKEELGSAVEEAEEGVVVVAYEHFVVSLEVMVAEIQSLNRSWEVEEPAFGLGEELALIPCD